MSTPVASPRRPEKAHADAPVIVVGYDGSEESRMALAVAAERAGPDGTVVPVHVTIAASNWLGASAYEPVVERVYQAAHERLAEIKDIDTGLGPRRAGVDRGRAGRSSAASRPQPRRARNRRRLTRTRTFPGNPRQRLPHAAPAS
jgi:hypothetical protein